MSEMKRPANINGIPDLYRRWERLETERREMSDILKDFFAEAKSHGLNPKALRVAFAEKFRDQSEDDDKRQKREANDADVELYLAALGSPSHACEDDMPPAGRSVAHTEAGKSRSDRNPAEIALVTAGETATNPVANVGEGANGAIAAAPVDPASRDADGADRQQPATSGFTGEDDGRDVEASGGAASVITNSPSARQSPAETPHVAASVADEDADSNSGSDADSSGDIPSPAESEADAISATNSSSLPHSSQAARPETVSSPPAVSGSFSKALSKVDQIRLLRPGCQFPGDDRCGGSGRQHCGSCRKAMAEKEEAA